MVEIDRVLPPINIKFEGNLDVKEIYKLVKDFLGKKGYDINEKWHDYLENERLKMKWEGEQNISDYIRFVMRVTVKGSKIKKVKLKEKEAFSGKFDIEIESEIHKDYQDYYGEKPIVKFFRELFDFITKKQEFNALGKQLIDESYALFDEIKAYLGLQKLQ